MSTVKRSFQKVKEGTQQSLVHTVQNVGKNAGMKFLKRKEIKMESHYEINVSLKGQHLFATAPRSCRSLQDVRKVYLQITERFPESEGFKVTVTNWNVEGESVDLSRGL